MPNAALPVACPGCDLIQHIPELQPGAKARCGRCGDTLAIESDHTLQRTLALCVAAAIVLVLANVTPVMGLSAAGLRSSTTLSGVAREMWLQGREATAAVIVFCAVVAPSAYVGFMLAVLLSLRQAREPAWLGTLMRATNFMMPWSMLEVVMLAVLVALIKVAALAHTSPGIGMYSMGMLVVLFAAIKVTFDPRAVWRQVRWTQ
jgi:paraquat-inducible protein A